MLPEKLETKKHYIGTLETYERDGAQPDALFGDEVNPFYPRHPGNQIDLPVDAEAAKYLQGLMARGGTTFADLGVGASQSGPLETFTEFQLHTVGDILSNDPGKGEVLTPDEQRAGLWGLHWFCANLFKAGGFRRAPK